MGKIINFIRAQWHDVKGNAKWDFIKWSFGGCVMIPTALTAFAEYTRHAPLSEVVIICLVVSIVLFFLWMGVVWLIFRSKQDSPAPFQPDDRVRKLFTTMVDNYKMRSIEDSRDMVTNYVRSLQPPNPICELIAIANEIQTEAELEWYCNEFVKHNYEHPLNIFQDTLKTEWLPVLVEARHSPKKITKMVEFCDFLIVRWSGSEKWKEANTRRNTVKLDEMIRRNFPERFQKVITIYSAIWQASEGKPFDVSEITRAHISDGKLEMRCTIDVLGDPRPGLGKVLTIDYWYDGQNHKKLYAEGRIAKLPL